jgi:hypothetical protein
MRLRQLRLLLRQRRHPPDRTGDSEHGDHQQRGRDQLAGIGTGRRLDDARQVRLRNLALVGVQLIQLAAGLTDELGVVADVATGVHRGAERLVVLGLDGFDDLRVRVYAFSHLQHGQPEFFAARTQTRADAASFHCHGDQPELRRSVSARV